MVGSDSGLTIHTFGLEPAQVRQRIGDLAEQPHVEVRSHGDVVAVHLRNTDPKQARVEGMLGDLAAQIEDRLGPFAYGRDAQSLSGALMGLLAQHKQTLTTAESCTGGLVGKKVTDVPGASEVYLGGWIVYSNAMKVQQLGVSERTLRQHGAVSESVVRAMALGSIQRSGADLSMAVTGVAGPTGGTIDKPVGMVWIGLGVRASDPTRVGNTHAFMCHFQGVRDVVRERAARCAIGLLRLTLLGAPTDALKGCSKK